MTLDMEPQISIIIPVYNAEVYLSQCLESIIAQTYQDWECILVDDGSKDASGRICDEYTARDSRFKTIHKQNGGVSTARNLGISMAIGEYLCFLDSDDQMKPTHLEIGLSKIGNADILIFGFERWNYRTDIRALSENTIVGKIQCHDYLYDLKENPYTSEFFCFPWNKLYKRSIIVENNISFPTDISFREDEIFGYRYIPYINKIVTISHVLVDYNDEPSGLSANRLKPEKSIPLAHHLIKQTKCDNSDKSKTILFFRAMTYLIDAVINTKSFAEKRRIIKSMIQIYSDREFEFDKNHVIGKSRHLLIKALANKSIISIYALSLYTSLRYYFRVYIKGDKDLKRWGTNV